MYLDNLQQFRVDKKKNFLYFVEEYNLIIFQILVQNYFLCKLFADKRKDIECQRKKLDNLLI